MAGRPRAWRLLVGTDVIAVLLAYVGNARYAFGVAPSRANLVKYLIANGTTILARMVVVWVLVGPLPLPEEWAPPAAVAVTMPVAFLLTKWAMAERPSRWRNPSLQPRGISSLT